MLPGAGGSWRSTDSALRGDSLNRRFTASNCSLREAVSTSHNSGNTPGVGSQSINSISEEWLEGDVYFLNGFWEFAHKRVYFLLIRLNALNILGGGFKSGTVLQIFCHIWVCG